MRWDSLLRCPAAATRWAAAVNRLGGFGTWRYQVVTDPPALTKVLDDLSRAAPPAGLFS